MSALEMNVETTQKVDAISVPEQVAGTSFKDETKPTIRTLALIKPDAMQANNKEAIIKQIKQHDFIIVQEREIHLSKENACLFYREHEGKPFYNDLTNWMSSAPVYALMLEKEDAIQSWRVLMGPTDSNKARQVEPTSIRAIFGTDGSHNATHGSDCLTSAEREIDLIFNQVKVTHDLAQEVLTDKICKPDVAVEVEVEATQIVNPDPTLLQTGDHVAHDISLVKNDTQDTNHFTPEQQASVQQVCPTKPEPEQQQQTPVQDFEHVLQICPAKPEAEQQLAGDFEQIGSAKRDTDKHQLTREILLVEESTAEPVITQVPSEQQVSGDKNQPTTQETLVVIEASIESSTSENLVAQEVVTDKSITADEKTSAAAAEQEMAKESVAVEEEKKTPAAKDDSVKESYLVKVDLAVEEIPATKEELIDNGDSVIKEEPVIKREEPVAKEEPVVKNEPVKEESVEDETVKDETEPKEDPIKEEPIVGVTVAVKEEPIVKDELIVEVAVAAKETPVTKDKSIVDAKDEFIVDAKEEPIVDAKEEPILEAKEEAIVEKTPVVKEESIVEETSAVKEAPIAEESSAVKEEPVAKENPIVDETPATKEDPVVEETSAVKEAPIAEESSAVKEEPVAKENPIVDETPATKEDPVVEETPVAKVDPVVEETPVVKEEETPVAKVDPVVEETPVVKEEETLAPKEDPVATQGAEGECIVITKEESDKKDHVVENKSDQSTADKEVIESYVAIAETAGAVNKAAVEGTKQAEQKPEQKMPSIADRKKLFTEIKKPEEKKQAKSVNDLIAALGGLKKTPMSSSVNKEKKVEKRIEVVQAPAVIVDVVEEPVPAALKPEPTTTTDNCCPEILDQVIIGVETKQEEQTEPESTKPAMILVNDKLSEAILDHHEEKEEEDNEIQEDQSSSSSIGQHVTTNESNTASSIISSEGDYEDHSSASSMDEKKPLKEVVKKTANKVSSVNNKRELKPRAPINKHHTTTLRKTIPEQDKKKDPVRKPLGLKKPTTLVKKPVIATTEEPKKPAAQTIKPKPKPASAAAARVPRVALLTKKVAAPSAESTEEKPKKATGSTRSLVSRLTAPTAASARRKEPVAKKPDTVSPPTSTPVKRVSKAPATTTTRASTTAATTTKPTTTVRRTSPPTSTPVTKKVTTTTTTTGSSSGIKQRTPIKSTVRAPTAVPVSKKPELKKTSGTPRKKLVKKKSVDAIQTPPPAAADHKETEEVVAQDVVHKVEDDHKGEPVQDEGSVQESEPEKQDERASGTEADEHEKLKVVVEAEDVKLVVEEAEDVKVEDAEDVKVEDAKAEDAEEAVAAKEEDVAKVEASPKEDQEELAGNEEEEEVSVIVSQEQETKKEDSHDAEVAEITQPNVKPQMASLRSRFEMFNNPNQLHTSSSKELRSKSPNRISDMINRFQ